MRFFGAFWIVCMCCAYQVSVHAQTQPQPTKPIPRPQAAQQKPKPLPVTVGVQVFVVTKGGQNIKLGLVSVSAYLASDVNKQVATIEESERPARSAARREVDKLEAELADVKTRDRELKAKYDSLQSQWIKADYRDPLKNQYFREQQAAMMEWLNQSSEPVRKAGELDRARRALARLSGVRNYIEGLSSPVDTTKTDADGVFELNVPPGKYVVTAISRRQVAGDLELYEWAVELEVRGAIKKLMLSNDNLWSPNCDDCLRLPTMQ